MPKDLEVIVVDQPGTLADALEGTGNAGVSTRADFAADGRVVVSADDVAGIQSALG